MHGRLKVKDSAEKAAEKAREREKKRKKYLAGINVLFEKRAAKEHSASALQVSGLLLQANPDALTIWNCRRETLLQLRCEYINKAEEEGKQDSPSEASDSEKSQVPSQSFLVTEDSPLPCPSLPSSWKDLFKSELEVVSACLEKNPKSYGAWHHRNWIIEQLCTFSEPGEKAALWAKELKLCDLFLSLDERNFHCWDYRRFITESSGAPNDKELRYSLELINRNFSNFSAWHYRSTLLPLVHPPEQNGIHPVSSKVFDRELRRIVEAIFTDPSDQSPWFFLRWLLQRPKPKAGLIVCGATRLSPSTGMIVCSFSRVVPLENLPQVAAVSSESGELCPLEVSWTNVHGHRNTKVWHASSIWSPKWKTLRIIPELGDAVDLPLSRIDDENPTASKLVASDPLAVILSKVTLDTLRELLQNCSELNQIDPDKKWVLFTLVQLLWTRGESADRAQAREILDQLCVVDPLRSGYYHDTKSRMAMEQRVKDYLQHCIDANRQYDDTNRQYDDANRQYDDADRQCDDADRQCDDAIRQYDDANRHRIPFDANFPPLQIRSAGLHRLSHCEYLSCTPALDLSDNKLSSLAAVACCSLCSSLVLDGNPVTSLEAVAKLPLLRDLSLKRCALQDGAILGPLLGVKSLRKLSLLGNLFSEESKEKVKAMFRHLDLEI